jgi:hypothetical protein
VELDDGRSLPVGRKYRELVQAALQPGSPLRTPR